MWTLTGSPGRGRHPCHVLRIRFLFKKPQKRPPRGPREVPKILQIHSKDASALPNVPFWAVQVWHPESSRGLHLFLVIFRTSWCMPPAVLGLSGTKMDCGGHLSICWRLFCNNICYRFCLTCSGNTSRPCTLEANVE